MLPADLRHQSVGLAFFRIATICVSLNFDLFISLPPSSMMSENFYLSVVHS